MAGGGYICPAAIFTHGETQLSSVTGLGREANISNRIVKGKPLLYRTDGQA